MIFIFKFHGLLFYVAHGMAIALLRRWKNSNALKRRRKMHFIWLTNPAVESQLKLERIVTHFSKIINLIKRSRVHKRLASLTLNALH